MRVLITGGTGFVGTNIAEKLLLEGHSVVLAARSPLIAQQEKALSPYSGKLEFARLDINDQARIGEILDSYSIDHVIHAAVITPGPNREQQESDKIIKVNYMGTVALLEEIKKRDIKKFLYLSSASVYGDAFYCNEYLYEDENITYPKPNALYGISKYAAEKTVLRYKQIFGINAVVARVGTVFGPWERYTGVRDTLSPPFAAIRLAVLGQTAILPREGVRDWVYSRDIANASYELICRNDCSYDVYNFSSGYLWSMADLCNKLTEHYPDFSYKIDPEDYSENSIPLYVNPDRCPMSIDRLINDVGYTPEFDLDKAVEDYMEWIKQMGDFWLYK
ncbi:MAG: putative NAD-dependent epimerase/dehydratase [Clostridiales bacterium]|jgi:nucleoside-diphosphate-sugar epimerase|nr:putative NAD-dependent epimerase/dehydratase [Clostridiales bacterium]